MGQTGGVGKVGMRVGSRALRRDAAANRDRVLTAATAAVKREGDKVPLATIAEDAGVGVGTLYRRFPTRADLLTAVADLSYRLVLEHARGAADSEEPAITSLGVFLDQVISDRDDLVLPMHGGPVALDQDTVALRTGISDTLEKVLHRGRRDGTVREDVTGVDIIIIGALLSRPLPHAPDWERTARRQARVYLDGLAMTAATPLPGHGPTRAELEAAFAETEQGKPQTT